LNSYGYVYCDHDNADCYCRSVSGYCCRRICSSEGIGQKSLCSTENFYLDDSCLYFRRSNRRDSSIGDYEHLPLTMHVIIRNVQDMLFDGFVKEVILPGADGEFSVWDFHQTLIARLSEGDVILGTDKNTPKKIVHISPGVAKFERGELGIMCL